MIYALVRTSDSTERACFIPIHHLLLTPLVSNLIHYSQTITQQSLSTPHRLAIPASELTGFLSHLQQMVKTRGS